MNITSLCEIGIRSLNEDAVFIDEDRGIFAVFDGASSLDDYKNSQGETGGYIASRTAVETFRASRALDLKSLFKEANKAIEKLHIEAHIDTSDAIHRFGTTIAAIWIHDDDLELLQCADSTVVVVDTANHAYAPLGYHDQDLSEMLEWQKLAKSGMKANEIKPLVRPMTIQKRHIVNTGFGMMNGDPRAEDCTAYMRMSLKDIRHLLLLTDGMYIPKEDPASDEDWQQYARLYRDGGLREIFKTVRQIESSDPDIIRYPRYKLHDDASAIAITM